MYRRVRAMLPSPLLLTTWFSLASCFLPVRLLRPALLSVNPSRFYASSAWDDASLGVPLFGGKGPSTTKKSPVLDNNNEPKSVLFVGNLPFDFSETDLSKLAKEHDASSGLLSSRITLNVKTQKSRGFGYLDYASPADAEAAASKLRGLEIGGRAVKVDLDAGADGPRKGRRASTVSKDFSVFVGNLDYSMREQDVEEVFRTELLKDININAGADESAEAFADDGAARPLTRLDLRCRLMLTEEGRSKGLGHVDFADAESVNRALFLNGFEVMGRPLIVEKAKGLPGAATQSTTSSSSGKQQQQQQHSIFLGNLAFEVTADDIADMCADLLGEGIVRRVRLSVDRETGQFKGFGHVDLGSTEDVERALTELSGVELCGRVIRVDRASWGEAGGPPGGRGGAPGGRGGSPFRGPPRGDRGGERGERGERGSRDRGGGRR